MPPVLQTRGPPPGVDGLPPTPQTGYNYVVLHLGFITITRRSINLAITAATLTFSALQSASLCLVGGAAGLRCAWRPHQLAACAMAAPGCCRARAAGPPAAAHAHRAAAATTLHHPPPPSTALHHQPRHHRCLRRAQVTTPGEEMALALQRWLAPLRLLRLPTREISMTLLLSLRFMSLVFEEVRNLSLGLAARGVDWRAQGGRGSLQMAVKLAVRLFGNLFERSEKIAQAMVVRGFLGPEDQQLYMMRVNETSVLANVLAVAALLGLCAGAYYLK